VSRWRVHFAAEDQSDPADFPGKAACRRGILIRIHTHFSGNLTAIFPETSSEFLKRRERFIP
jgi:hypothetical protein